MMGLPCRHRVDAEELVDQLDTSIDDIRDTERDQATVNRWLGGANATMLHVMPLLKTCASDPIKILDAACGGGDLSRKIVDAARKLARRVEVTCLDLNEKATECARKSSLNYSEMAFVHADALSPPFGHGEFDIVIMSTFLHHLSPDKVVVALRVARELSRGTVIAADLVRSPWAYLGIRVFAWLARFSPISAHDGAVSVCRAYTPPELAALARQAGLEDSRIYRHWIYRMTLVYHIDSPDREAVSGDG